MFSNIVRGGQTLLHRIRMFQQVVGISLKIGVCLGIIFCGIYVYKAVPSYVWPQVMSYGQAAIRVNVFGSKGAIQSFKLRNGKVINTTARKILNDAEVAHNVKFVGRQFESGSWWGLYIWLGFLCSRYCFGERMDAA